MGFLVPVPVDGRTQEPHVESVLVASEPKEVVRSKANKKLGQSSQWVERSEEVTIGKTYGEEVGSEKSTMRLVRRGLSARKKNW